MNSILWTEWSKAFSGLRGAFSRTSTFLWAAILCAGMATRTDLRGLSSIVSILGLKSAAYYSILRVCHSDALDLDRLRELWVKVCFKIFSPICVDGYLVLLGDGIKIAKEGKKMPAVKLMHQQSQNNSKAEYIMGHFLQAISLVVVSPLGRLAAIPVVARIHDGIVYSNRSQQTVIHRFTGLIDKITTDAERQGIIVADAYYAVKTMISEAAKIGCVLVSRVQHNCAAYYPALPPKIKKRGRPAKKGAKVKLKSLFKNFDKIAISYGDYSYYCINLYWESARGIVRFVLVEHKTKGRAIYLTTKIDLNPTTIIEIYATRWLIETGFKQAISVIGTFAYHFWMKQMEPIRRGVTKQYMHRKPEEYRSLISRKLKAIHTHIAFGCIVQGLALHLSLNFHCQVWTSFNGWLRTFNKTQEPSELVVANALRSTLPIYLGAGKNIADWAKFMLRKIDSAREGPLTRAA
jgi:hypothetical protein